MISASLFLLISCCTFSRSPIVNTYQGEITVPVQEEFLTNWGNQALSQSENGIRLSYAQSANDLKSKGFSESEALDILGANDTHNFRLIQSAVELAFGKEVVASPVEKKKSEAYVVPTSYKEIAEIVEAKLKQNGPRQFMNKLARSKSPIMPLNEKSFNSYLRLASLAVKDQSSMNQLHNELKKWFEESMYVSVCAAKSTKNEIRVASKNNGKFVATNLRGASCDVCLESGTCSCSKFSQSNYGEFGLACEHIVAAADQVSPHQRLLKAITEVDNISVASDIDVEEKPNLFNSKTIVRS